MTLAATREHIGQLCRELTEFDGIEPRAIRRKALLTLRDAVDADFSTFYNIVEIDGVRQPTDIQVEGDSDSRWLEGAIQSAPAEVHWLFDVRRPPEEVLRHFQSPISMFSRAGFESTPIYQHLWKPIGAKDCAGLLVFHGPRYLGSPSAVWRQPGEWVNERLELLQPLVEPVRAAIIAAHCLASQGLPTEAGFVLVRPDGTFEHASADGDAWIARAEVADAIRRRVRNLDRDREPGESTTLENAEARVVRLSTKEGTRYLVCLRPAPLISRNPAELLTPLQFRIASSAASGASAAQIAQDLGRSTETVREHLAEVYRRLRVSTRVELALALSENSRCA